MESSLLILVELNIFDPNSEYKVIDGILLAR